MSKTRIREDKTCLNCNHVVEHRFCPNCGQLNSETRKTFHQLFVHFFEDLTHYEHSFWKTIRNLLLKPAALTKEYLSGKRMSYLAPVRLYIFISLVTFFYLATRPQGEVPLKGDTNVANGPIADTAVVVKGDPIEFNYGRFATVRELDSVQKIPAEKLPQFEYELVRKITAVAENNTSEELFVKFRESFIRNLPKVLFIYMPIFAFILWLFQSKKRWYYFDHGIFTLHYFSFLLLMYLMLSLASDLLQIFDTQVTNAIDFILRVVGLCWMFYYFFPAHHRFYGEMRFTSCVKGIVMFIINLFFITLILLLFAIYTFINIH